jgi:hypothetical protein
MLRNLLLGSVNEIGMGLFTFVDSEVVNAYYRKTGDKESDLRSGRIATARSASTLASSANETEGRPASTEGSNHSTSMSQSRIRGCPLHFLSFSLAYLLVSVGGVLRAQNAQGTIVGHITDPSEQAIEGQK